MEAKLLDLVSGERRASKYAAKSTIKPASKTARKAQRAVSKPLDAIKLLKDHKGCPTDGACRPVRRR